MDDFNLLGVVMNPFGPSGPLHHILAPPYVSLFNLSSIKGITSTVENLTHMLISFNDVLMLSIGTCEDYLEQSLEEVLAEEISSQLASCHEEYEVVLTTLHCFFHSKLVVWLRSLYIVVMKWNIFIQVSFYKKNWIQMTIKSLKVSHLFILLHILT
jgi:hypothetical protein